MTADLSRDVFAEVSRMQHTLSEQCEDCSSQLCVLLCVELIPSDANLRNGGGMELKVCLQCSAGDTAIFQHRSIAASRDPHHMLKYSVTKVLHFYLVAALHQLQCHLNRTMGLATLQLQLQDVHSHTAT